MTTIGIDPAKLCGFAAIADNGDYIDSAHYHLAPAKAAARDNWLMYDRLGAYIVTWAHRHDPSLLAWEHTIYRHANAAAIHARMGMVINTTCNRLGLPVVTVAPSEVKLIACGSGKATGAGVAAAAAEKWLGCQPDNWSEDEGAALWVAHLGREKLETE